jgi:hypothetical protein
MKGYRLTRKIYKPEDRVEEPDNNADHIAMRII